MHLLEQHHSQPAPRMLQPDHLQVPNRHTAPVRGRAHWAVQHPKDTPTPCAIPITSCTIPFPSTSSPSYFPFAKPR